MAENCCTHKAEKSPFYVASARWPQASSRTQSENHVRKKRKHRQRKTRTAPGQKEMIDICGEHHKIHCVWATLNSIPVGLWVWMVFGDGHQTNFSAKNVSENGSQKSQSGLYDTHTIWKLSIIPQQARPLKKTQLVSRLNSLIKNDRLKPIDWSFDFVC